MIFNSSNKNSDIKYVLSDWNPSKEDINKSASFTGHRPNKYDYSSLEYIPIRHKAYREIQTTMENGYCYYLVGGCSGFDLIALNYCLKLKDQFGYNIKTICILPYENFYLSNHFDDYWRKFYIKLVNQCDIVTNPSGSKDFISNSQYMDRNRVLVDSSNLLIAFNPLGQGGSNNTVQYAHKKGIKVIDLA